MRPAERDLPLRHALALGLLQGPTELLPVSSSAHTTLLPLLAGWPYAELDGEQRKSFEVALHAGAGLALAVHLRRELRAGAALLDRRWAQLLALSLAPPVLIGLLLGPLIERRLGGRASIVAGLVAGAVAMALADTRGATGGRGWSEASTGDGLALGVAQALALVPGVSRNGATLTAARARGFDRRGAQVLSWGVALPVVLGAAALQSVRLLRRPAAGRTGGCELALGAGAAFVSTSAAARLIGPRRRGLPALLPLAGYRLALAALAIAHGRRRT